MHANNKDFVKTKNITLQQIELQTYTGQDETTLNDAHLPDECIYHNEGDENIEKLSLDTRDIFQKYYNANTWGNSKISKIKISFSLTFTLVLA